MADHEKIMTAVLAHKGACDACGSEVIVYQPPKGPRAQNWPKPIRFEVTPVEPGRGRYALTPKGDGTLHGEEVAEAMGRHLQRDGYPLFERHKNNCRYGERKPR